MSLALPELQAVIRAVDEFSGTLKTIENNTKTSMGEVEKSQDGVNRSQQVVASSTKETALAFNNLATGAFGLYNAIDNVMDSQLNLSRAHLQVTSTTNSLEDAERRYADAVAKEGASSEKAVAAQKDLELARERHTVALERESIAQGNFNEGIIKSALTVMPSLITVISSAVSIKGALTAATVAHSAAETAGTATTGLFAAAQSALNAVLNMNPLIWVVIAIGALIAVLVLAYQNCKPFKDAIDAIGKAIGDFLKPIIDAIVKGLEWLWNNVLVPLANFLSSVFMAAINAVGAALGWLAGLLKPIGDAIGWVAGVIGNAWNSLTTAVSNAVDNMNKSATIAADVNKQMAERMNDANMSVADKAEVTMGRTAMAIESVSNSIPVVGGVMNAMKDAVLGFTGQTVAYYEAWRDESIWTVEATLNAEMNLINTHYDEELKKVEEALNTELATINAKYDEMVKAADETYKTELDAFSTFWDQKYNDTTTALDKVKETINTHYDEEVQKVSDSYDTQIAETNALYDDLQAATDAGLAKLRAARSADLDNLEMNMLQQKLALKASYESGAIDKETYEKQINELSKKYNSERSKMNDTYRLEELTQEKANATATQKIAEDRKTAVTTIETQKNTELKGIETKRTADLTAAETGYKTIVDKHTNEIKNIETSRAKETTAAVDAANVQKRTLTAQREAEINAAVTKAETEKQNIINTSNSKIQSSSTSAWSNIGSTISGACSKIGSSVSSWASGVWNSVSSAFSGIANTVGSAMSGVASTVGNALSGAWNSISSFIGKICFAHALERAAKSSAVTMTSWLGMMETNLGDGMGAIQGFNGTLDSMGGLTASVGMTASAVPTAPYTAGAAAGAWTEPKTINVYPTIQIGKVTNAVELEELQDKVTDGTDKAFSEKYRRRGNNVR